MKIGSVYNPILGIFENHFSFACSNIKSKFWIMVEFFQHSKKLSTCHVFINRKATMQIANLYLLIVYNDATM
jgi:hypothetical protein